MRSFGIRVQRSIVGGYGPQQCQRFPGDLPVTSRCVFLHRGSATSGLPAPGLPAVHRLPGAVLGRPQLRRRLCYSGLCSGGEAGGPGPSRGLECGGEPMHEHLPAGTIGTGAARSVPLPRQGLQLFRHQRTERGVRHGHHRDVGLVLLLLL